MSLAVDIGRSWVELAGIVVEGRAELLVPEDTTMRGPMSAWHDKYRALLSGDGFPRFTEEIRKLGFLRVVPERLLSWDHARG